MSATIHASELYTLLDFPLIALMCRVHSAPLLPRLLWALMKSWRPSLNRISLMILLMMLFKLSLSVLSC